MRVLIINIRGRKAQIMMEEKNMAKQHHKTSDVRVEDRKLYEASLDLSKDIRKKLGLRFPVKIFVQDPLVAQKHKRGRHPGNRGH